MGHGSSTSSISDKNGSSYAQCCWNLVTILKLTTTCKLCGQHATLTDVARIFNNKAEAMQWVTRTRITDQLLFPVLPAVPQSPCRVSASKCN